MNKYMFDENQSLRINFEKLVGTVHVVLQANLLYRKKNKIFEEMTTTKEETCRLGATIIISQGNLYEMEEGDPKKTFAEFRFDRI